MWVVVLFGFSGRGVFPLDFHRAKTKLESAVVFAAFTQFPCVENRPWRIACRGCQV